MSGKTTITQKQKDVLRELVGFICQTCMQNEEQVGKLEPHRIIRGNCGGKYTPNNILLICNECHKTLHRGEFK